MKLFKKAKPNLEEPMDLDSVMKKFDQESNVRIWEGKPRIAVNVILATFSLFCLYVTLFTSWLEELRLTTFVAWIVFLGFLVFPARKSHQRVNHIPWYDVVMMVLGTGAFLYYSANAITIIQQGSLFHPYQIIIGIIGIVAVDGIVAGVLIRFEVGARGCRLFVIEPVFVKPENVDDFASEREVDGDVIAGDGEIEDVVDRIAGFERLGELDLVFARGR